MSQTRSSHPFYLCHKIPNNLQALELVVRTMVFSILWTSTTWNILGCENESKVEYSYEKKNNSSEV